MAKKKKNRKIGYAPGTIIYTGDKLDNKLAIDIFNFSVKGFTEKELTEIKDLEKYNDPNNVCWVNLNGLNHTNAIKDISGFYKLHHLIAEDITNIQQRTKVDIYPNCAFFVLKMLYFNDQKELQGEQISFVLGDNYLLSFQEAEGDVFNNIRDRIRNGKGLVRERKSDYLLYLLLDAIVDSYFLIIDEVGEKIDFYENKILNKQNDDDITFEIQNLKREIFRLRKVIYPLKDLFNNLLETNQKFIRAETNFYFKDLEDHLLQVIDSLEVYREMVVGLMEMQLTVVSNKMNSVMKVLTIIATIFIPMTFIAGVYGMNFKYIPELELKYGYFLFWAIIVIILVISIIYFKRKKWL